MTYYWKRLVPKKSKSGKSLKTHKSVPLKYLVEPKGPKLREAIFLEPLLEALHGALFKTNEKLEENKNKDKHTLISKIGKARAWS